MDKVALEQVFLRVLRFSPVSIIPPMLHTRLRLGVHVALTKGQTGNAWEPSKKQYPIGNREALDRKAFSLFCSQIFPVYVYETLKKTLFWIEVQFMNVRLGGARSDHWSLKG